MDGGSQATRTMALNFSRLTTSNTLLGNIPANAVIDEFYVTVLTASNAGTTATITVGNVSAGNQYAAAASALAAGKVTPGGSVPALGVPLAAATPVWAVYAETGTPSTVGAFQVVCRYHF
jgi:hypothetical protein